MLLIVILTRAVREAVHNNGSGPLPKYLGVPAISLPIHNLLLKQ